MARTACAAAGAPRGAALDGGGTAALRQAGPAADAAAGRLGPPRPVRGRAALADAHLPRTRRGARPRRPQPLPPHDRAEHALDELARRRVAVSLVRLS